MKNALFALIAMTILPFVHINAQEVTLTDNEKPDSGIPTVEEPSKEKNDDFSKLTLEEKNESGF